MTRKRCSVFLVMFVVCVDISDLKPMCMWVDHKTKKIPKAFIWQKTVSTVWKLALKCLMHVNWKDLNRNRIEKHAAFSYPILYSVLASCCWSSVQAFLHWNRMTEIEYGLSSAVTLGELFKITKSKDHLVMILLCHGSGRSSTCM